MKLKFHEEKRQTPRPAGFQVSLLLPKVLSGETALTEKVSSPGYSYQWVYELPEITNWLSQFKTPTRAMMDADLLERGRDWYLKRSGRLYGPSSLDQWARASMHEALLPGDLLFNPQTTTVLQPTFLAQMTQAQNQQLFYFDRATARTAFTVQVRVSGPSFNFASIAIDVSTNGMSIASSQQIEMGAELGVSVPEFGLKSQISATVVSSEPNGDLHRIGLKLTRVPKDVAQAIKKRIA